MLSWQVRRKGWKSWQRRSGTTSMSGDHWELHLRWGVVQRDGRHRETNIGKARTNVCRKVTIKQTLPHGGASKSSDGGGSILAHSIGVLWTCRWWNLYMIQRVRLLCCWHPYLYHIGTFEQRLCLARAFSRLRRWYKTFSPPTECLNIVDRAL